MAQEPEDYVKMSWAAAELMHTTGPVEPPVSPAAEPHPNEVASEKPIRKRR